MTTATEPLASAASIAAPVVKAPKVITEEQKQLMQDMVARARVALDTIKDYDQARVDRLCQALGWAVANQTTFTRLSLKSIDESPLALLPVWCPSRMPRSPRL